jgi:hypothetical protein
VTVKSNMLWDVSPRRPVNFHQLMRVNALLATWRSNMYAYKQLTSKKQAESTRLAALLSDTCFASEGKKNEHEKLVTEGKMFRF